MAIQVGALRQVEPHERNLNEADVTVVRQLPKGLQCCARRVAIPISYTERERPVTPGDRRAVAECVPNPKAASAPNGSWVT
jgi:hypothetical protein